jgi:hypothetical protein
MHRAKAVQLVAPQRQREGGEGLRRAAERRDRRLLFAEVAGEGEEGRPAAERGEDTDRAEGAQGGRAR